MAYATTSALEDRPPSASIVRRTVGDRLSAAVARSPATGGRTDLPSDGRREKFNHETFMRPGVLTIRRQIAKRRRSEIIRNLQLTDAGRRDSTRDALTDGLSGRVQGPVD